jgi:hypothetical protein
MKAIQQQQADLWAKLEMSLSKGNNIKDSQPLCGANLGCVVGNTSYKYDTCCIATRIWHINHRKKWERHVSSPERNVG